MPSKKPPEEKKFAKKKVGAKKVVIKKPITKTEIIKPIITKKVIKKTPIKKVVAKKTIKRKIIPAKDRELNERLSTIYRDKNGKIPNMREIKVRKSHSILRGFFTLLIVAGLMAVTAWAGFFYLPAQDKSDDQVSLEIVGPQDVEMGATTTYRLVFKNNEDIMMKNVILSINYPENFVFFESSLPADNPGNTEWRLGDLPPKKEAELTVTGHSFGEQEKPGSWRAFINYTPENFNSEMQSVATLETKIVSAPVNLVLSGPEKTLLGDDAQYTFKIERPDNYPITSLKIKPELPDNFFISSSSPELDTDGFWLMETAGDTEGENEAEVNNEFILIGKFNDTGDSVALNTAKIGGVVYVPYQDKDYEITRTEMDTELAQNKYTLSLAINGSLNNFNSQPGEMLNITAQFKNTGDEILKDVNIKMNLDSPSLNNRSSLNWGELDDELSGDIIGEQLTKDIRRGQISWRARHLSDLAEVMPGDEVSIDVQIPVQTTARFDLSSLKEHIVNVLLEAKFTDKDSKERQVTSNKIDITLNSDLALEVRSRQVTEDGIEKRRVTWLLNNTFHPLKDVKLTAELFGKSEYVAPEDLPAGEMNYNDEEKRITWNIPEMPLELETAAVTFDVVILEKDPTQNTIMGKSTLEATDAVTGQKIYLAGNEIKI